MYWCYYTLEIKFQHWKNHQHTYSEICQTALTMTALLPQGSVLPCLKPESASFPVSAAAGLRCWQLGCMWAFMHGQWEELQPLSSGSLSRTLFVQEFATLLNVSLLNQIPPHWLKHSSKVSISCLFTPKYTARRAKGQEQQQTLCMRFPFSITAAFHHVTHPRVTVSGLGM